MAWTPTDPAADIRLVRLLIPDTDPDELSFDDQAIIDLLRLEGSPRLAAATGLDVIASDAAMVLKVIRTQDLTTDGAKVADSLHKRAAMLRAQESDALDDEAGGTLTIVNYDPSYLGSLVELGEIEWC